MAIQTQRICIVVSRTQKEQILQNCKVLGYENLSEYVRDSVIKKNFLIIDRLDKIMKFMEGMKNGEASS